MRIGRGAIVQPQMRPAVIVDPYGLLEGRFGLILCPESPAHFVFLLEDAVDPLGQCFLVAVYDLGHADRQPAGLRDGKRPTCSWQQYWQPRSDVRADDLARIGVGDQGSVEKPLFGADVRQIAHLGLIRNVRTYPRQQIVKHWQAVPAVRRVWRPPLGHHQQIALGQQFKETVTPDAHPGPRPPEDQHPEDTTTYGPQGASANARSKSRTRCRNSLTAVCSSGFMTDTTFLNKWLLPYRHNQYATVPCPLTPYARPASKGLWYRPFPTSQTSCSLNASLYRITDRISLLSLKNKCQSTVGRDSTNRHKIMYTFGRRR